MSDTVPVKNPSAYMVKIDVVVNVYGKPYNTAVTILSLLKYSGQWIDKIYFVEERKQPEGSDFSFLFELLGDKLVLFKPKHWLYLDTVDKSKLSNEDYRHSIRYQYGWEKSDKDFLFIIHNDVLFKDDIIKALLDNIGDNIGIGRIGQCGNCPAYTAQTCNRYNYFDFRPTKTDLKELLHKYKSRRSESYDNILLDNEAWPLPECRLNEWVALVNLKLAREETIPKGKAIPFGAYDGLDLGTKWFYDISQKGYRLIHYDFTEIAIHAWANVIPNGHSALLDKDLYEKSEHVAHEYLIKELGVSQEKLVLKKNGLLNKIRSFLKK